jgi:penicillin amidase
MSYDPTTYRSLEALRLLEQPGKISFAGLRDIAYSTHSVMMASWVPQLVKAFEKVAATSPSLQASLGAAIDTLRQWNHYTSTGSTATTLAVFWTQALNVRISRKFPSTVPFYHPSIAPYLHSTQFPFADTTAVNALQEAVAEINKRFGTTFIPWGEVCRLQRIHTSGTLEKFDGSKPSLPIAYIEGRLGALPAFGHRGTDGKRLYGTSGNSYVAIVELGKKVKAKSVVTFGQSADPSSLHFFDQAALFAEGRMKEAWFYKDDVLKHAQRTYHPGE